MHPTKIEWGDRSWSPITGCKGECIYCISRNSSRRFAGDIRMNKRQKDKYEYDGNMYIVNKQFEADNGMKLSSPFGFEPTYHRYSLKRLETLKTPMTVIVSPNGEVFGEWVSDDIIKEIFDAALEHPEQRFMFLTSYPIRYVQLSAKGLLPSHKNMWYGYTVNSGTAAILPFGIYNKYINIEPLLGPVIDIPRDTKWVLIGAERGRRSLKVIPKWEWIKDILDECDSYNIPVYMLESLRPFVPEGEMRKDKPKELTQKSFSAKKEAMYFDYCRMCGVRLQKRDMALIHAKYKRGEYPKAAGYLCKDCFKQMCEEWNLDYVSE